MPLIRRVAVLSSTPDLMYAPLLPLACSAWRALDYYPHCILVQPSKWTSGTSRVVLDHLGPSDVSFFDSSRCPNLSRYKPSTLAQCSRLVAAVVSNDDDYLLTSDADMLPISKRFFHQQDMSKPFHVLGHDVRTPHHFNMCYLGGPAKSWRDIAQITETSLESALDRLLGKRADDWCLDEAMTHYLLPRWSRFPEVELIHRPWTQGVGHRIDRENWLPQMTDAIDCHCLRPLLDHWSSLTIVLKRLLDESELRRLRTYVESLKRAASGS